MDAETIGKGVRMAYHFVGSTPSDVTLVCGFVRGQMEQIKEHCCLDDDVLMDLRLILSELMINGCEHGNANDREKRVTLELIVDEECIDIRVKDEGKGIAYNVRSAQTPHLSCGGRGLRIVRALTDSMQICNNEVHCTMHSHHGINAG